MQKMRQGRSLLWVVALSFVSAGCYIKGPASFASAVTPQEQELVKGDPYAYGGVADPSGGLRPKATYGRGAQNLSGEKVDPAYDQPAKGTGQHPGEYPNESRPGFGQSNSPALQPLPGAVQ